MQSSSDIHASMASDADLVSFEMRLWLNKIVDSQIKDAAMFSCLETSGKKIRPILFLEVLRLFGFDTAKFLSVAAAIEMCHVYSLVHDDLPSLDNDDFRRGVPSCHKKFNEAVALLTGNSLLTICFEIIASCESISYEKRCLLIQKLTQAVGGNGMMQGQERDIALKSNVLDIDTLKNLYDLKTGRLMRFCCVSAAIIANASEQELENIDKFASNLGFLFQATDDILDYEDRKSEECNIVGSVGIKTAQEFVKKTFTETILALDIFGDRANMLRSLALMVLNRKN
jgi:geranylgeranyl pyrophosphate synthase